jgi:hypothetical protein
MTNGRNDAVQLQEEDDHERDALFIAKTAAPYVASRDKTRPEAIKMATDFLRESRLADGDLSGTLDVENTLPKLSSQAPPGQIQRITEELMDAARDAADEL